MRINPWGAAGWSLARPRSGEKSGQPGKQILFALVLIFLIVTWGLHILWAQEEEPLPPKPATPEATEVVSGPVNYDRAVQLAILKSPYFTKSSLEIEVKRLNEKDSQYDLIPPVNFRTQYYASRPSGSTNRPYSLSFSSTNYNPLESYFTLQAKKVFTQMSILAHMHLINEGIQKLGRMFLEMEALKKAAARQEELVDLAQKNQDYFQNRARIGSGTSLEVRVAAQELEAAKAEKERIANSQKRLLERIKIFIGMKPHEPLDLDCKDARRQVMGNFDPAAASLEQAKNHSYEIKIAELQKELQSYNILLAKAKLLPSIFGGALTPDPLSAVQSRDMFFYVGLEVPVWDGFKRLRNISRQKTILRQIEVDTNLKTSDLADKWFDAQENLRAADAARKSAQAQEELARLKERQSEIRYRSGGESLVVYLDGRKSLVDAQRNYFMKTLDYDLAVLGLRHLSGDLGATYVDAKSWQQ
jgi:outer membrane protein TolC